MLSDMQKPPFSQQWVKQKLTKKTFILINYKGYRDPSKVSFYLGLHFLYHALLFAELGKPR